MGGNLQHLLDDNNPEEKVNTTLGGRVDVARLFDDIEVVGSITVRIACYCPPFVSTKQILWQVVTCKPCHSVVAATEACFCSGREHQGDHAAPWTKDVLVTAEKRVNGEQLLAAPLCHGRVPTGLPQTVRCAQSAAPYLASQRLRRGYRALQLP